MTITMNMTMNILQLRPCKRLFSRPTYLLGVPRTARADVLSRKLPTLTQISGCEISGNTPTALATLGGGIEDEDLATAARNSGNRCLGSF